MNIVKKILPALLFASVASSCSHHKIAYNSSASNEENGKGLTAQVIWLKPKSNAVDIRLTLVNNYEHPISFQPTSMKLSFNGVPGAMGTNEFTGEMAAGSAQTGTLIYKFEPKAPKVGTVVFTIDPVYQGENAVLDKTGKAKQLPALKVNLPVQ